MIHWICSPHLRVSGSDAVAAPKFVTVNDINERAVGKFRRQVDEAIDSGQGVIPVVVNSAGGDVYALNSMLQIMMDAERHAPVATILDGKAMSAGAVLLACGTPGHKYASPTGTAMIHEAGTSTYGKTADVESTAREMRRLDDATYAIMDARCGQRRGYFRDLVQSRRNADWFLSAQQCKRHGIVTHVGFPEMAIAIDVQFAFGLPRVEKPKATKKGKR